MRTSYSPFEEAIIYSAILVLPLVLVSLTAL